MGHAHARPDALYQRQVILLVTAASPLLTEEPRQLGVGEYRELNVGTPFNFAEQAITYVPANIADPSRERVAFDNAAINEIRSLVTASDGRALVLFTSVKAMKAAYEALSQVLPYTCLMQGQAPNKVLAAQFAYLRKRSVALETAVVLGTLGATATCGAAFALFVGALRNSAAVTMLFGLFGFALLCTILAITAFMIEMLMAGRGLRAEVSRKQQTVEPPDCEGMSS